MTTSYGPPKPNPPYWADGRYPGWRIKREGETYCVQMRSLFGWIMARREFGEGPYEFASENEAREFIKAEVEREKGKQDVEYIYP